MENEGVIVFANLRQRTGVVGEYDAVKAKAQPFVANNAKGTLREVASYEEVRAIARESAVGLAHMKKKNT